MIDRLLTESDPNTKPQNQNFPLDQDIHRFNELLDMIDQPVNTNDYNEPHIQKPLQPTCSVVEAHKPYLASPDSEAAAAQAVQLKVDEKNQIQSPEMVEKSNIASSTCK